MPRSAVYKNPYSLLQNLAVIVLSFFLYLNFVQSITQEL